MARSSSTAPSTAKCCRVRRGLRNRALADGLGVSLRTLGRWLRVLVRLGLVHVEGFARRTGGWDRWIVREPEGAVAAALQRLAQAEANSVVVEWASGAVGPERRPHVREL
jgi:DNA-binding transcriptional ArsR family regulator